MVTHASCLLATNQMGATAGWQGSEPAIKNVKISCLAAEFNGDLAISFAKNTKGFLSARRGVGNFSSHLALEMEHHIRLGVVEDQASGSISA